MKPTQARPSSYWTSNDPADLWFDDAGREAPQTIRCYNMHDHLNRGEARDVPVETLEFLAAGIFGEARPSDLGPTTRWTGDSHRYGIYRNPTGLYRNGIVVIECHGAGMSGYAFDSLVAGETWKHVANAFPPEMIWNICNLFVDAYRTARDAERHFMGRAFLEDRLKKRRRNHRVHVEILPPQIPASQ